MFSEKGDRLSFFLISHLNLSFTDLVLCLNPIFIMLKSNHMWAAVLILPIGLACSLKSALLF